MNLVNLAVDFCYKLFFGRIYNILSVVLRSLQSVVHKFTSVHYQLSIKFRVPVQMSSLM